MSGKKGKTPRVPENEPLSEVEKEVMSSMREQYGEQITKLNVSENTLLRFIRGYKDDPKPKEKALSMLANMLKWREEQKVDEVAASELPKSDVFKKLWPSGFYGYGKQGHPVYIDRVGKVDGSKLMKEFTMDDVIKFHIQLMERITKLKDEISQRENRRVYKQIVVLDLKGLGMSHLGKNFTDPLKTFIHIDQDFYPETLFTMVIVNAGLLVKTAWAIASPFIDPITKENIHFGNDALKEFIDPSQIPTIYGGQLVTDLTE